MSSAALSAPGTRRRVSVFFWRRPRLLLALLLAPPLLWLGVVYLGSMLALLIQSFFSVDEFTGLIQRKLTLHTYAQLIQPAHFDIIARTTIMAAAVTLATARNAAGTGTGQAWG